MADLVASAVDRANLGSLLTERAEGYERMANMDPLTGLANRRAFERVLEMELAREAAMEAQKQKEREN